MTKTDLPAMAMKEPAGHEIFSDGEIWESTHR